MKKCSIPLCNYPEGECQELCTSPQEARQDVIGLNGNTGEHYDQPSYADEIMARLIIMKKIQMDVINDVSNGLLFIAQTNLYRMRRVLTEMEEITYNKIDQRHKGH